MFGGEEEKSKLSLAVVRVLSSLFVFVDEQEVVVV